MNSQRKSINKLNTGDGVLEEWINAQRNLVFDF